MLEFLKVDEGGASPAEGKKSFTLADLILPTASASGPTSILIKAARSNTACKSDSSGSIRPSA